MNELERRDILRVSNEEAQRITQECLKIALYKLMARKDFDDISISDIVRAAGVSRNAFYRNYGSKEALLESLGDAIVGELDRVLPRYGQADEVAFIRFYRAIVEKAEYFRILLVVRKSLADRLYSKSTTYAQVAWKGAFTQLTEIWFEKGMKESPEEMGSICFKLLSGIGQEDCK